MTNEEVLDFYDEHWNDYSKVVDMLHNILDEHDEQIAGLEKKLTESYLSSGKTQPAVEVQNSESQTVKELKSLLQECQDRLDEETHKIVN